MSAPTVPKRRACDAIETFVPTESILETIDRSPAWLNLAGAGHWALRPRYRVITRFEHRALRDQRRVYEIAIAKVTG